MRCEYSSLCGKLFEKVDLILSYFYLNYLTAPLSRRWDLYPYSLNLGWPHDLLWPIEYGRNDGVSILGLISTGIALYLLCLLDPAYPSSEQTPRCNLLEDERTCGAETKCPR